MKALKSFALTWLILLTCALYPMRADELSKKLTPLLVDLKALRSPEGLLLEKKVAKTETVEVEGREVVLRHYVFRFFSQRFMDEDWWHDAHLFVPVQLADEARGKLFLASHVVNWRKVPALSLIHI